MFLAIVTEIPEMKRISTSFMMSSIPLLNIFPKKKVLIINGDMNAQIDKDENNKIHLHNLVKRNCEYQTDFSTWNCISYLNTEFPKDERKNMDQHIPK